jgi:hypothetical protein
MNKEEKMHKSLYSLAGFLGTHAMEDDDNFQALSLDDRLAHKVFQLIFTKHDVVMEGTPQCI